MTAVPVGYGAERQEIEGGEKLGGEVMHGGLVVRGSRIYDRRCSQTTKRADLESKEMEAETEGTNTHKEPSIRTCISCLRTHTMAYVCTSAIGSSIKSQGK